MIHQHNGPILYVDDTVEQRYVMRRILEGAGFSVIEAGTGKEALEKLQQKPQLIVLDVKLPDMSGYEVCRKIKTNLDTSLIPVLQISASFIDPSKRAAGLSGGADAYLAQPVHPDELVALVNALIRSADTEKMLHFLATVSAKITRSLKLAETLDAVEEAFVPAFADKCFVQLLASETATSRRHALPVQLAETASSVVRTGKASLLIEEQGGICAIAVPLKTGSRRIGSLIFQVDGNQRCYSEADLQYAEDFADRAALAIQNARLYTAQQAAQEALVQSEKLAAAGRLSSAIAHELNNPLAAITNLVYLIRTAKAATPDIKEYAEEALSELTRVAHITRQTLGFYRELRKPTEFELSECIDETLHLYEKRLASKWILVERDYREPVYVYAVQGELRQVISNLILNSVEAVDVKGKLAIFVGKTSDDQAKIQLSDNGHGIPEDIQDKIFDPFFTTKQDTGTGLGLWVSKNIIEKHGGNISISSSSQGEGASFTITLPLAHTEKLCIPA